MSTEATDMRWAAVDAAVAAPARRSTTRSLRHRLAASKPGRFAISVAPPFLVLALAILAWDTWVTTQDVPKYMVPRPTAVLDRFPWLGLVGAALIGWIAGEVMAGDGRHDEVDAAGKLVEVVKPGTVAAWLDSTIPHAEMVCGALGAGFVIVLGLYLARRARHAEKT